METKPAQQFPDALDGIQIRTVGRKVVQPKVWYLGISPGFVHFRMMIRGVVTDDHDALAFLLAPLLKELQEIPETLPVKSIGLSRINKLTIAQAHGSKVSYTPSSGVVQDDRVPVFGWHPHAAPGAVLLEMNLVQCP